MLATVALLGWLLGPVALVGFAGLAVRRVLEGASGRSEALAVQAGRHPASVLAYLGLLVAAGLVGIALRV